jgi:MFS family permease
MLWHGTSPEDSGDGAGGYAGGLWRVYAACLLLTTADGLSSTLAPPYLQALGFPYAEIGLLVAVYAVTSLVSRAPAGRLAESAHAGRWFAVACGLFALALALYPLATTTPLVLAVRALNGVGFGAAQTLNFAAFLAISARGGLARATALYTASMSLGYAIGNFSSGALADQLGTGPTFLIGSLVPLGALAAARSAGPARMSASLPAPSFSWRSLLRADVLAVAALAFSLNGQVLVLSTLFPLYALAIGQTLSVAGVARGLNSLSNTLVRPFGGPLINRLGMVALGWLGVALMSGASAALALTTTPLALFVLFTLGGIGRAGGVLANAMSAVALSERRVLNRGAASAVITAGGDLGSIAGPLVGGLVAGQLGVGPALSVVSLGAGVVGLVALFVGRLSDDRLDVE